MIHSILAVIYLNKLQADAAKQAEEKVQIQVKKEREN